MNFFWCQGIFFVNFDFKNGCKNEFQDNNAKSCSRFRNKVPLKIDFRADRTHESYPTAWELINEILRNGRLYNFLQSLVKI